MPFVTSLNYCLACWSHVTKWNVLCSTHSNTEGVIYFTWHSTPFNIRLRTPCTNIFVGALGLRYVQIHSAAWCYHYCGHVHATFMKAVIYLSKYVFSNCLSFFVGGKWRHYNVTIKRGYMDSPFSSISTPFYYIACLALMVMFCISGRNCPHMIPQLDWISHQLRLAVESGQNTNPLNKGVRFFPTT